MPLLFAWVLIAASYAAKAALTASVTPPILDSDDAMRLNEVHDFLNGQGWFDLVQHRLNTPFGAELHWSRLVDLPEAALLLILRPIFGGTADFAAAYAWPLLLLLPFLWLCARLAIALGGREALWPGLLLPGLSLIGMGEFAPGRFDHHSVQILLTLVVLLATLVALGRPRAAVIAGVAGAAALTVGIEGLPMIAMATICYALLWVASPRHATALRDFGLSFGLAMALGLAQGVTPANWFVLRLDAISIVYVVAALLGAAAFVVLSLLPMRGTIARLAAALVAGFVVAGAMLLIDPAILNGPYAALDPWLVANWLSKVAESETWRQSFIEDPVYPLAVTVPAVVALAVSLWNAVRAPADKARWWISAGFLATGLWVMLIQIRAARIVTPLAIPADAALIAAAWRASLTRKGLLPALGVVASSLASAGLAVAVLVALVPLPATLSNAAEGSRTACLQPSAFADLAGLPPERIMAPNDLGSHLLLFTPHPVVGAPYHRNQDGLLDTFRFFNGPIDEARQILKRRGIGLVVICPAMREITGLVDHTADSFVALYAAHHLPDWLVDESLPGSPLRVYSVTP